MNRRHLLFALLALAGSAFVRPQPAAGTRSVAAVVDEMINGPEKDLLGVAETMPDDAYEFAPTNGNFRGVRNFAKQVKHAAAVNNLVAATILGEKISADLADERGPDSLTTKADIVKYARDSFAHLRRAASKVDGRNAFVAFGQDGGTRMGMIATAISHASNHYGQLVEYLRMKGLAPPQG